MSDFMKTATFCYKRRLFIKKYSAQVYKKLRRRKRRKLWRLRIMMNDELLQNIIRMMMMITSGIIIIVAIKRNLRFNLRLSRFAQNLRFLTTNQL